MSSLTSIDKFRLEKALNMAGGYVLGFTDRTFAEFFRNNLGIQIYSPQFDIYGRSKAKHMRAFWDVASDEQVAKCLNVLFTNWDIFGNTEKVPDNIFSIIYRLNPSLRKDTNQKTEEPKEKKIDLSELKNSFLDIEKFTPQERGFALEKFLTQLFLKVDMKPRSPFRVTGEQIDGSFELEGHIYLVEAKWTKTPIAVDPLYVFQSKVKTKSPWTRGLFLSINGFSEQGIIAFSQGEATRLIGFDGLDLLQILDGEISLKNAILAKVRLAAEEGRFYVPLFNIIRNL